MLEKTLASTQKGGRLHDQRTPPCRAPQQRELRHGFFPKRSASNG
jgi:hypothetical protein